MIPGIFQVIPFSLSFHGKNLNELECVWHLLILLWLYDKQNWLLPRRKNGIFTVQETGNTGIAPGLIGLLELDFGKLQGLTGQSMRLIRETSVSVLKSLLCFTKAEQLKESKLTG